ncbi:MAG: GDSL-type esterase/lipase family protein [bacterium]
MLFKLGVTSQIDLLFNYISLFALFFSFLVFLSGTFICRSKRNIYNNKLAVRSLSALLSLTTLFTLLTFTEWGLRIFCPNTWSEASQWRWYATKVRKNKIGLRSSEIDINNQSNAKRILILGDSFAYGFKVDQDKILSSRLEEKLLKRFPAEVINASFPNWSIVHQKHFFERLGYALKPDLVVICHVLNDIESVNPKLKISKLYVFLKYNLYLTGLFNPLISLFSENSAIVDMQSAYTANTIPWNNYFNNLEVLNSEIKDANSSLIFLIFPWFSNFNPYPFNEAHNNLKNGLKQMGIESLDLLDIYKHYPAKDLIVSYRDLHPNSLSHELAAEELYKVIVKHLK